MFEKNNSGFIKIAQLTLIFVYVVIIAGAVVRATGSGMGCPDWPKCFGKWVPPTDVSQLPENYKEVYAGQHHAVAEFNVLNTWTEYLNRLAGAILGVLIFIQFLFSIRLRKKNKELFIYSFIELLLIGFQGWLGAKVVSSNLAPVKITVHMIVALVILAIAWLIIHWAKKELRPQGKYTFNPGLKKISLVVFVCTIFQVMLGTQVREEVDVLLHNLDDLYRTELIENLGLFFKIHRSFSIVILALNAWMIYKIHRTAGVDPAIRKQAVGLGWILSISLVTGIVLSRFSLPAPVQPLHLLLACIIYGMQWLLILKFWRA